MVYLTLIRSFRFFHPSCILYMCLCGGLEIAILNDATNNYQILAIEWWWADIHIWSKVYLTHGNLTMLFTIIFVCFTNKSNCWSGHMTWRCITWKDMENPSTITMGCPSQNMLFNTWITIFEALIHKSSVVDEKLSNVSPNPPTYIMSFLATKVSV